MVVAQLLDDRRQGEPLERRRIGRDSAERRADAGVLAEHVDAEAPAVRRHVREVDVVTLAQPVLVGLADDLGDVAFQLRLAQVAELDRHQIAVHAQERRQADGEMDVRAALVGAELEECVDACHAGRERTATG